MPLVVFLQVIDSIIVHFIFQVLKEKGVVYDTIASELLTFCKYALGSFGFDLVLEVHDVFLERIDRASREELCALNFTERFVAGLAVDGGVTAKGGVRWACLAHRNLCEGESEEGLGERAHFVLESFKNF